MRKLTINIDVDGVLYDFNGRMHAVAEEFLDRRLPESQSWAMWKAWGVTGREWHEMFLDAITHREVFSSGEKIPGGTEAVIELAGRHRVRIVTSKIIRGERPGSTRQAVGQTLDWLDRHGVLDAGVEVCFTPDKQGYVADVVVDDKPTLSWAQPSAANLLFDQPWNRAIDSEPHGVHYERVYRWGDVLQVVTALEGSEGPGAGGV